MDELDKKLKNYFESVKSYDSASVPNFDVMIGASVQKKKNKIPFFLKVAASVALVVSVSWFYWLRTPKNQHLMVPNTITASLLRAPTYLWDWESPTQSLLSPIEFELKKIEK